LVFNFVWKKRKKKPYLDNRWCFDVSQVIAKHDSRILIFCQEEEKLKLEAAVLGF
jgi:hypothetical protein